MILEVLLTPQSQRDFLYQECVGLDSNQRGFTFHECMTLNEAILYWKCFFHFQNRLVGNPLLQLSYIIFFFVNSQHWSFPPSIFVSQSHRMERTSKYHPVPTLQLWTWRFCTSIWLLKTLSSLNFFLIWDALIISMAQSSPQSWLTRQSGVSRKMEIEKSSIAFGTLLD